MKDKNDVSQCQCQTCGHEVSRVCICSYIDHGSEYSDCPVHGRQLSCPNCGKSVDVSDSAKRAFIALPVFVSKAIHDHIKGDEKALNNLFFAFNASENNDGPRKTFTFRFQSEEIPVVAVCGPRSETDATPVISIGYDVYSCPLKKS